jgi:hypothetical protein
MTGQATSKVLSADKRLQEKRRKQTLLLLASESNPDRVYYDEPYPIAMLTNEGHQGIYRIFYDKEGEIENYNLLIGASFRFIRIVRPHESSKIGFASAILEFTNQKGDTQTIEVTRQSLKDENFKDRLIGFATFHSKANLDKELWAFINKHSIAIEPLTQDAVDSHGWHKDRSDRLVFAQENGSETVDGFEDENKSQIILQFGRGLYHGARIDKPSDEVMKLLLCDLNPHIDIINFAMAGSIFHLMWPEANGKAPFNFELAGSKRVGKSTFINSWQSLFTALIPLGARKLRPASLSIPNAKGKDSVIGRNLILGISRYIVIVDCDYKEKPGNPLFERKYEVRCELVNDYGDKNKGGVISSRDQKPKSRQDYQGLIVRTMEFDHAIYSIEKGNHSTEERAFTFIWPVDEQGNGIVSDKNVSIEIEKRLIEIYAIGVDFRRWIMSMTEDWRKDLYEKASLKAFDKVKAQWTDSIGDLHQDFCIYVLTGVFLFLEYLKTNLRCKGRGKKDKPSFMVEWFEFRIESFIKERRERSLWILGQIQENKPKSLSDFVIDTIRLLTLHSDHYIANHQGNPLEITKGKERDLPTIPEKLGYHLNGKGYIANKHLLGYFSNDLTYIEFEIEDFHRILSKQADIDRYQSLPSSKKLGSTLCDVELATKPNPDKEGVQRYVHSKKIGKESMRTIRIPVSNIFSIENTEDQFSDLPAGLINQTNGDGTNGD